MISCVLLLTTIFVTQRIFLSIDLGYFFYKQLRYKSRAKSCLIFTAIFTLKFAS